MKVPKFTKTMAKAMFGNNWKNVYKSYTKHKIPVFVTKAKEVYHINALNDTFIKTSDNTEVTIRDLSKDEMDKALGIAVGILIDDHFELTDDVPVAVIITGSKVYVTVYSLYAITACRNGTLLCIDDTHYGTSLPIGLDLNFAKVYLDTPRKKEKSAK